MRTIWKYELSTPINSIQMPMGAQILTAQFQGDDLCIWALVDSERQMEERIFERHVTGGNVGPAPHTCIRKYIGTVQTLISHMVIVFHVFELVNFGGPMGSPSESKDHRE